MRSYASASDYTDSPFATATVPSDKALALASLEVDAALIATEYRVDADNMPVDDRVREALRDATCAVLAWWDETGDTTGSGAGAQWQSASIADASYTRAPGAPVAGASLPARAATVLRVAGLLSPTVYVHG